MKVPIINAAQLQLRDGSSLLCIKSNVFQSSKDKKHVRLHGRNRIQLHEKLLGKITGNSFHDATETTTSLIEDRGEIPINQLIMMMI